MPAPEAEGRPGLRPDAHGPRGLGKLRGFLKLPGLARLSGRVRLPGFLKPFGLLKQSGLLKQFGLASLLTEVRCPHCARPLEKARRGAGGFCPECLALFPRRYSGYCPRCAEPATEHDAPLALCATCLVTPPPWQPAFFYGVYEGPLREALLRLKFGAGLHLAKALAGLLASVPELRDWVANCAANCASGCAANCEAGRDANYDAGCAANCEANRASGRLTGHVTGLATGLAGSHAESAKNAAHVKNAQSAPLVIVPVPLHPRRQLGRGFNQSLELARALGRELNIPVKPELLRRQRGGKAQRGLGKTARRANMDDAFVASPAAQGLRLLVLDDIKTTGATLRAATLALQAQGAASVSVAAIASTPK